MTLLDLVAKKRDAAIRTGNSHMALFWSMVLTRLMEAGNA